MNEIYWPSFFFLLFAGIACAFAVAVVITPNIVRMAFYLVLSLAASAGLFFLAGADFVGSMQIMIYVGGTLVLLVFGVMLTATGPFVRIKSSAADGILSGLIGVVFLFIVSSTVAAVKWDDVSQKVAIGTHQKAVEIGFNPAQQGNTSRALGLSFLSLRADRDFKHLLPSEQPISETTSDSPGMSGMPGMMPPTSIPHPAPLSAGYLLPFEIVSVHLLVVLVGAAYLARAKRRVAA